MNETELWDALDNYCPSCKGINSDVCSGQFHTVLLDFVTAIAGSSLAAQFLGLKGGAKGGHARAASLSPERRAEIASLAAKIRWSQPR